MRLHLGLKTIFEKKSYSIYEETNSKLSKDTSRMLHSGAVKVTLPKSLMTGCYLFSIKIKDLIPEGTPIICESPALRNYIEPGYLS